MKKLTSIFLALTLLFTMLCLPAVAESALPATNEAKVLVETLGLLPESALPAEDGEDAVTRGEFAYAATKLLNIDASALGIENTFYDMESHTYASEVAVLASRGVVEGCTGNVFVPDRAITLIEAIKILTRALGYSDIINANGGSQAAYYSQANDIGLLKNISFTGTAEVTYDKAVTLLFNALCASPTEMISFGEDVAFESSRTKTTMSVYHDIYKNTGTVFSVGDVTIKASGKVADGKVLIGKDKLTNEFSSINSLLGMSVRYYYRSTISDETKYLICAAANKDVKVLSLDSEDIYDCKSKVVTYFDENEEKRTATIETAHDAVKNGNVLGGVSDSDLKIGSGKVTLIDNDGNNKYDVVIINETADFVVTGTTEKNGKITIKPAFNLPWIEIDTANSNVVVNATDSEGSKIEDLTSIEGIVSIAANSMGKSAEGYPTIKSDATYFDITVCTNTAEGVYDSIDDENIYLDGKAYKLSKTNYLAKTPLDLGTGVVVYLNYLGEVVNWEEGDAATGSKEFGYLITGAQKGTIGSAMDLKILNAGNEVVVYQVNKNAKLNGTPIKSFKDLETALYTSARHANPKKTDMTQLIKYKLNGDGEVSEIETTLCSEGLPVGADENHLRISKNDYKIARKGAKGNYVDMATGFTGIITTNATIHFMVPSVDYAGDDNVYKIVNITDSVWELYEAYAKVVDIYNLDDTIIPEVMVIYGTSGDEAIEEYVMFDKIINGTDEEGFATQYARVVNAHSGAFDYAIDKPEKFKGVEQGDVITIYGRNEKITDVKVEYAIKDIKAMAKTYKEAGANTIWTASDTGKVGFGEVYAINGEAVKMQSGAKVPGALKNERETQWSFHWTGASDYFKYGAMVYDAESGSKVKISKGKDQKGDIVCAIQNPDNPTLVLSHARSGDSRLLVFYKGLDTTPAQ